MCFELDSLPPIPALSGGAPVRLGGRHARGRRRSAVRGLRGAARRADARSASSCSPTSAGSTGSTRSSRCASPSAATPPSRSTTSVAPRALASATTSSRTWSTWRRRRPTGSSRTRAPPSSTCAPRGRRLHDGVHGRLLLRRPQLVARGGRRARPRRRDRLLRLHGRAQRPAGADAAGGGVRGADPGAAGRRRRAHPARAQRGLRSGARRPPGSSTSSSSTRARRTASSTAATRSSPTRRRTPGSACWRSSHATRRPAVDGTIRASGHASCASIAAVANVAGDSPALAGAGLGRLSRDPDQGGRPSPHPSGSRRDGTGGTRPDSSHTRR